MDAVVLNKLKRKTIKDFCEFLKKVRKGYKPNYEFILEEISYIDLIENFEIDEKSSLIALLYYLNNLWQTTQ